MNIRKIFSTSILSALIIFLMAGSVFSDVNNGVYIDQSGNQINFNLGVTTTVKKTNSVVNLPSSVVPVKITNPFAAAGQPVQVQVTVQNLGANYPFNQISLPPNQFALTIGVDQDLGYALCPNLKDQNGQAVPIRYWNLMTEPEKAAFTQIAGVRAAGSAIWSSILGQSCRYVDILQPDPAHQVLWVNYSSVGGIPYSVQQEMANACNAIGQSLGQANYSVQPTDFVSNVYEWDCLKVVDEPLFNNQIKSVCPNGIDQACVKSLNAASVVSNVAPYVQSKVNVFLTDGIGNGTAPPLNPGQCTRDFWGNVLCSIGQNGIQPGGSMTFNFYILVPADTPVAPVLSQQVFSAQGQFIQANSNQLPPAFQYDTAVQPSGVFTQSSSCLNQGGFQQSCHSVYVAVFPVPVNNLLHQGALAIQTIGNWIGCFFGKGLFTGLFQQGLGGIVSGTSLCSATSNGVQVEGNPIAEGVGIFFVFGAQLGFSIQMLLIGALAAGFGSVLLGGKK